MAKRKMNRPVQKETPVKKGRVRLGTVGRKSPSSLVFVTKEGVVYEVPRNTKGRPKGSKNRKNRK